MAENREAIKKIEAVLFLAARYLTTDDIVMFTGVNPLTVKELMQEIKKRYDREGSGLTLLKQELQGQELWKMDVKQEFHSLINKIATGESEFTKAEQETLAIIAYKKPIKQSVVVKIRGNKAYDHIKHFIECGLLKSKRAGRTYELNVSDRFFDYFNLDKENKEIEKKEVNAGENAIVGS